MKPTTDSTSTPAIPTGYRRLRVGDRVRDCEGDIGTIIEIEDQHNVHVDLDDNGFGKGRGIYCQVKNCEEYRPLTYIAPVRRRKGGKKGKKL